jgi:hypothetical protein
MNKEEEFINQLIDCHFIEDTVDDRRIILDMLKKYKAQAITEYEAITEHEAGKWLPYPQNKPEKKQGWYLVTMGVDQKFTTVTDAYWMGNSWNRLHIIAFRELPEPYKEGGEKKDDYYRINQGSYGELEGGEE